MADGANGSSARTGSPACVGASGGRLLLTIALLWLCGMALRLTILAAAPVLPLIHRDLDMSETAIGTLGSLPSLLFAFAAVPGALLIARVGTLTTIVAGLARTAVGSALRGAAPDVVMLDFATIVMGCGIAIMQPAMPQAVRQWMPERVGFGTAVYTNGLLVSELIAVALAIPFVLPLVSGSWRWSLVLLAAPIALTALLVIAYAPRQGAGGARRVETSRKWWPDWRDPLVWRLGLLLGSVNTIYWSANTFLPDYLHATGRGAMVGDVLSALNGWQIPGSLLMIAFAGRVVRNHATYLAMGALAAASVLGIVLSNGSSIMIWAAILGFANAIALILLLALPALLAAPQDVHRLSAAMFTLSYPCAVVFPILGGFAWDITHIAALAFLPAALGAVVIMGLSPGLDLRRS